MFLWIYLINTNTKSNDTFDELNLMNYFSDIQKITIHKGFPENESISLLKQNLNWQISGKYNWPVSEYNISRLIGRLRHFQAINALSIDQAEKEGEKLSDYGLQEPSMKIDILSSFGEISLHFGNETRNGQKLHMQVVYKKEKSKNIWIVNKSLKDAASINTKEWLKKEFVDIPVYDIKSFSITTYTDDNLLKTKFEKFESNNWNMSTPIRTNADTNAIRMFLSRLINTRISDFINDEVEENLVRSKLERPLIKIRIEGKTKNVELILGRKLENKVERDLYPAKIIGNDNLFLLDKNILDFISNTENKLRDKKLFHLVTDKVATCEIFTENSKLSLHKLDNARWEVLFIENTKKLTTRPGDNEIIINFLDQINSFQILSFINDSPSNNDLLAYGLDETNKIINIVHDNGNAHKLRIGKYNTDLNGYYVQLNNEPSVYTCGETIPLLFDYKAKFFRARTIDKLPKLSKIESIEIRTLGGNSQTHNLEIDSTTEIHKMIREFNVKAFVKEEFSRKYALINGKEYPWKYSLLVNIINPNGINDRKEVIQYFITDQIHRFGFICGSPRSNVTFVMTEHNSNILKNIIIKTGIKYKK